MTRRAAAQHYRQSFLLVRQAVAAVLCLFAFPLLTPPAYGADGAGTGPSGSTFPGDQPWRETPAVLPSYPADADLVRVPPQPTDTFKVFVDARSVSVGADSVMRMTFVVESPSGVRNVFYDGIRCAKVEYKTYAIGTADRRMQAVADARWQVIGPIGPNNFRRYVYQTLVCRRVPMPSAEEFIRELKGIKYQGFDSY